MPLISSSTAARIPAHGFGSGVTGRSELNAMRTPARTSARCGAKSSRATSGNTLGATVDEHLDRTGADDLAAEACLHAKTRCGLEQLPRQELVDAQVELGVHC